MSHSLARLSLSLLLEQRKPRTKSADKLSQVTHYIRQAEGWRERSSGEQAGRPRSALLVSNRMTLDKSLPSASGSFHISKPRILALVSQGGSENGQKNRWAVTWSPAPLPSPGTNALEPADQQGYSRVDWGLAQQKSTSQPPLGALHNATGTK